MGKAKKEVNRRANDPKTTSRITKPLKGENFYRDAKKVKMANMLKSGRPTRNADGEIIKPAAYQSRLPSGTVGRIQPDRRWFGNTRTIGQQQLEQFREAIKTKVNNPFEVLLHRNKLPMSLLTEPISKSRMDLLSAEPYNDTFGSKAQRKRPKLQVGSVEELSKHADVKFEKYDEEKDSSLLANQIEDNAVVAREWYERAGQSRRIWGELYKVIDSSDVIIHVLDARDPIGTRCRAVERFIKKEAPHKHLFYVLNKCDLVPTWVTVTIFYFPSSFII